MNRQGFAVPSGIVVGSLLAAWIDGLSTVAFAFVIVLCIGFAKAIAGLFPASKK
ncbi:hypothetical protein J2847_003938 [Azospirillum agricola]|uniref:hypothetical protein n=1 Tax=Azospirillum agricola TaxID=1720247 RepID=UPI001AE805C9|nr:hypothetical protein [Azospirillum agricola]MBP2230633.1 hypothetical protein [Azospirillum agricola]